MGCLKWATNPGERHVFRLCVASIIITAIAAVVGIVGFALSESSLMLCYGVENCLDLMSSSVVLWRFYKPGKSEERIAMLNKREKRASVAISFILFLLGIAVVIMAMIDFKVPNIVLEGHVIYLLIFSGVSFAVFAVLTWAKLRMAKALGSRSLQKDGLCSLIGTVLSGSLIITTLLTIENKELWWLDPLAAIICGMASLVFGLRSVLLQTCEKGIPIYSPRWWIFSQDTRGLKESQTEMTEVVNGSGADVEGQQQTGTNPPIVYDDLDSTCDENMDDLTLASTDDRNN